MPVFYRCCPQHTPTHSPAPVMTPLPCPGAAAVQSFKPGSALRLTATGAIRASYTAFVIASTSAAPATWEGLHAAAHMCREGPCKYAYLRCFKGCRSLMYCICEGPNKQCGGVTTQTAGARRGSTCSCRHSQYTPFHPRAVCQPQQDKVVSSSLDAGESVMQV
jgi:hypothetical protein